MTRQEREIVLSIIDAVKTICTCSHNYNVSLDYLIEDIVIYLFAVMLDYINIFRRYSALFH